MKRKSTRYPINRALVYPHIFLSCDTRKLKVFLSFTKWTWQCILACYNFTVGFLPPNKRAHLIWTQMMSSAFPVRALSLGCLRFLWLICRKHYALGKIVEGTPVLLFLLEHCWHCSSEVCQEPTSWSKKHMVTVKKKKTHSFYWDTLRCHNQSSFYLLLPTALFFAPSAVPTQS